MVVDIDIDTVFVVAEVVLVVGSVVILERNFDNFVVLEC